MNLYGNVKRNGVLQMKHLKTENCIVCGKEAVAWHGYVRAKDKMALGNYVDVKVISGFCKEHMSDMENDLVQGQPYNSKKMGKCIPLF